MKKTLFFCVLTFVLFSSCGEPLPTHLTITFKGLLMEGMKYSQPFGDIFRFEIIQADEGLVVRVTDRKGKKDLSSPEPSDNSHSRYLKTSHVLHYTPTEKKQADYTSPPFRREFSWVPEGEFNPPPEPGRAEFTLIDYSISKNNKNIFKWIQFECVLTWKEWDRAASQPVTSNQ